MKDPSFTIIYEPAAALRVQRERVWLCNNRGRERADAFEDDFAHLLDLLSRFPYMGDASPENEEERHWFCAEAACGARGDHGALPGESMVSRARSMVHLAQGSRYDMSPARTLAPRPETVKRSSHSSKG
jgi:plasmid stabilization system protein ParE